MGSRVPSVSAAGMNDILRGEVSVGTAGTSEGTAGISVGATGAYGVIQV
jgi:hypothetical protein